MLNIDDVIGTCTRTVVTKIGVYCTLKYSQSKQILSTSRPVCLQTCLLSQFAFRLTHKSKPLAVHDCTPVSYINKELGN